MLKIPDLHNWRANLSPQALEDLQKQLTFKTLKTDEVLYAAGDISTYCYQIESGSIRICNYHSEGREVILAHLYEQDCLGDLGLLSDTPRINFAIADTETRVNVIKRQELKSLCQKHPEILWHMNKHLSYRMELMLSIIEEACLLPLSDRIIKVLVRLGLSKGDIDSQGNTVICNLSQENLGRMVGATRQSVGRELKQMQANGLIIIEYSRFILPDIQKLCQLYDDIISHKAIVPEYNPKAS
ncbi:Crp/Fnr family transcriptional regulator [Shewanella gaetbuli]|uniref:Crp/Fnr family transcriptional regulator n=1 Tax=Shewanella gaetbuli TaxID=220752 RepID=A0A9X1ZJ56_9GAMM|nr:Crp/Fnr family transcriptional regulator [Shewanella gaetbuli]MCL1142703.1 Crp/Fnr family transcriptional regulator [Shewanella gaetbuli]